MIRDALLNSPGHAAGPGARPALPSPASPGGSRRPVAGRGRPRAGGRVRGRRRRGRVRSRFIRDLCLLDRRRAPRRDGVARAGLRAATAVGLHPPVRPRAHRGGAGSSREGGGERGAIRPRRGLPPGRPPAPEARCRAPAAARAEGIALPDLRRHGAAPRTGRRGPGRARLDREERDADRPRRRLERRPRRDPDRRRARLDRASRRTARHLRQLRRLPRRLPDAGLPGTGPPRREEVPRLPDDREARGRSLPRRRPPSTGASSAATPARTSARGTRTSVRPVPRAARRRRSTRVASRD